jgi:hypothetical protein
MPQFGNSPYQPDSWQPNPLVEQPVKLIVNDPQFWFQADLLYWWTKASPVPAPLVTTGVLGQPGTTTLMGNEDISAGGRTGGRFTMGFALTPDRGWGLEFNYGYLADRWRTEQLTSSGGPGSATLYIPYFNPNTQSEDSTFLSLPGSFSGDARLRTQEYFQTFESNLQYNLQRRKGFRFDMLGGFRWVNLQERLTFVTDSPDLGAYNVFSTWDDFQTCNNFYGGQIGLKATYDDPRVFLTVAGKLALGAMVESVRVDGFTYVGNSSGELLFPGGYFTQPTNIGTQNRTQFAVVPEIDLNCGIRLAPWASFIVGYSFLYASSVARPGEQIDRVINPTQSPAISGTNVLSGPARPGLAVRDSDFWAQGVNFSLELRF